VGSATGEGDTLKIESSGGFTIAESAVALGSLRYWELELHRLLGSAVPHIENHELKLLCADLSEHHAWHGEMLAERMPTVRDLSPAAQTVGTRAAVSVVEALDDADDISRAAWFGAYARWVLPQLLGSYVAYRAGRSPVADAAVIRTVGFVIDDLSADLATASMVASSATQDSDDLRAGEGLVTRLNAHRLEFGPLTAT